MKRTALGAILLAWAQLGWGDFTWENSSTNRVTYADGGTNYIQGNKTNVTVGCFVQLIYAGANRTNDAAIDGGSGVSADDVVMSNFWMGVNFPGENGYTKDGLFTNDAEGFYFVRVWTAPSPDITNGLAPVSPTNFYGDSMLFSNPCPACVPPFETHWNFGGPGFAASRKTVFVDSDGDGLPDWWELLHFGSSTNAAAGADGDGDRMSNFEEYVAGTQPTNGLSTFRVTSIAAKPSEAVIKWSSVAAKLYAVQRSTSATGSFSTVVSNIVAVPPENTFTDTFSAVQFYRLQVR